jgi:hypothetical protein
MGHDKLTGQDKLIGRGAYLTIAHSVDAAGKTWANIMGAMTPPKGADVPKIPGDFVRHKDKDAAPQAAQSGPGGSGALDEPAPF